MGHENIGHIAKAGRKFSERKGVQEGDLVFVEHYVPCCNCGWCHHGEYRHCDATDWRANPDSRRYGYTTSDNPYHLWGGFAQYTYLPWNAVVHKVPPNVTPELAGIVTPLSNGIEWALFDYRWATPRRCSSRGRGSRACRRSSPANRPARI